MIGFIVIVFSLLLFGGTPIGLTLGLTGLFALLRIGDPRLLTLVARRIFSGMNFFPLLAIPFFIMAGEIMNKTGITVHLIRFANVLVGHVRGGLAQVNILASIFFAGITGAAVADAAALGSVLIPAMVQENYDTGFSAAVTAASSIIGPIIPPSIIMVVYGYTMRVSIAALFAAGVVPGILIGIALMIMSWFICEREDYGPPRPKATFAEFRAVLREGILALIMPAIILGGILSGVFTPTEAAAVAVAYAAFVGFVIFRTLRLRDFPDIIYRTVVSSSVIYLIIGCASIFSYVLADQRVPELAANIILSFSSNKYVVLLLMNILLLIAGMFMEISANVLILGPILAPIAIGLGVDPLHFGIIMIVNLNIGLVTPPLGECLFIVCGLTGLSLEEVAQKTLPFILMEILALLLITYVEFLPMFLPRLLGFA